MNRTLIACVGNIFLGDDGFGAEVARRLHQLTLPTEVTVVDFGIRALDLAYTLNEGYERVILVDTTCQRTGRPGQLHVLELTPEFIGYSPTATLTGKHNFNPNRIFEIIRKLGGKCPRMVQIGCEPESLGDAEFGFVGLTESVAVAVDEALEIILQMLEVPVAVHAKRPELQL